MSPEDVRAMVQRMAADATEIVENLRAIYGDDLAHILTVLADVTNCIAILERFPVPANVIHKLRESVGTIGVYIARAKGFPPERTATDLAALCSRSLVIQVVQNPKRGRD